VTPAGCACDRADPVVRTSDPIFGAAIVFDVFAMSASAQVLSRRLPDGLATRWGLARFAVGMALLAVAWS